MIVFDLHCGAGHRFEAWFGSSSDFAHQHERGLIACPSCGSPDVAKAPMAPAVPAKANAGPPSAPAAGPARQVANAPVPAEVREALAALAKAQAKALKDSTWVGERFAEEARAMHYGERDAALVHGQASLAEAKALVEEGVPVAPLLFPVAPPDKLN